jgi:hypothetical protein
MPCEKNDLTKMLALALRGELTLPTEVWVLTLLLVLLLFSPVALFLASGWGSRRREILDSFPQEAIWTYLYQFHRKISQTVKSRPDLPGALQTLYDRHFGWKRFLLPSLMLALSGVCALVFLLAIEALFPDLASPKEGSPRLSPIALSAIFGAYTFVLSDFVGKSMRRALAPPDLHWAAFRFTIAVPLSFAVVSVAKDAAGMVMAFGLSAFPTQALLDAIRRVGRKHLNLGEFPDGEASQLQLLESLDQRTAERLGNENITNIVQLAYCDPIVTAFRTNVELDAMVDYVSQALLWVCAKNGFSKFQNLGIRGARELLMLSRSKGMANELKAAVKGAQMSEFTLSSVIDQLDRNRNAVFIFDFSYNRPQLGSG